MLNPAAAQIAKKLSDMLVGKSFARFQFDDQFAVNQQIGKIITENRSILVQHLQSVLLFNLNARLAKPIGQPVLINLFQMPVPQDSGARQTQFHELGHRVGIFPFEFFIFLCLLCLFAACFIS